MGLISDFLKKTAGVGERPCQNVYVDVQTRTYKPHSVIDMVFQKLLAKMNVSLYRATGGSLGGSFHGAPVLLLTVTGRKTGKTRTTPLLFLREGENVVVVAANGGRDREPAWWTNLRKNPDAEVEIKRSKTRVRAEKADPVEKERLWALLTKMYHSYENYQKRTDREIPVVILRPA